jgi:hypothetical protein
MPQALQLTILARAGVSSALLDAAGLLIAMAYVDLSPIRSSAASGGSTPRTNIFEDSIGANDNATMHEM